MAGQGFWGIIRNYSCTVAPFKSVQVLLQSMQVVDLVQQGERPLPVRSCSGMLKSSEAIGGLPCTGPSAQALMAAPMETGSTDCTSKTKLPETTRPKSLRQKPTGVNFPLRASEEAVSQVGSKLSEYMSRMTPDLQRRSKASSSDSKMTNKKRACNQTKANERTWCKTERKHRSEVSSFHNWRNPQKRCRWAKLGCSSYSTCRSHFALNLCNVEPMSQQDVRQEQSASQSDGSDDDFYVSQIGCLSSPTASAELSGLLSGDTD